MNSKLFIYSIFAGFVTTTRLTHATPAALYAKSVQRDWECDVSIPEESRKLDGLKDIARQLVQEAPGNKLNVSKLFYFSQNK